MGKVGKCLVKVALVATAFAGFATVSVADQNGPTLAWGKSGSIDERATPVGYEAKGAGLYACVGDFNNGRHPGKIGPSTGSCSIGYGGKEHTLYSYDVYVP